MPATYQDADHGGNARRVLNCILDSNLLLLLPNDFLTIHPVTPATVPHQSVPGEQPAHPGD